MQRCLRVFSRRSYSSATPWFIDEPTPTLSTFQPSQLTPNIPENTPNVIRVLHAQLAQSPHLEPSTLVVTESVAPSPGPALPLRKPQGRRSRGGTYAGESAYDVPGSLWKWIVTAQVKAGTDNKGSIESVVRTVRKARAVVNRRTTSASAIKFKKTDA
ncbi:hypothetical protein H0H92_002636 [Tricholoma furcatifolium]|nr:hypothetical protein H0H92_002636 [Tricholoma furcatifolium]